jgi:hypothetical protein
MWYKLFQNRTKLNIVVKDHEPSSEFAEYDFDEVDNEPPAAASDEEDWGSSRKKRKRPGAGQQSGPTSSSASKSKRISNNNQTANPSTNSGTFVSGGGVPQPSTPQNSGGGGGPNGEPRPFACNRIQIKYKFDFFISINLSIFKLLFYALDCGAKYKSRPGLTYHRIHVHGNNNGGGGSGGDVAASKSGSPSTQIICSSE